jgi:hypothetical protein
MDGQSFSLGKTLFASGKKLSPREKTSAHQPSTILARRADSICLQVFPSRKKFFAEGNVSPHHTVDGQYFSDIRKIDFGATQNYPQKRFHDLR